MQYKYSLISFKNIVSGFKVDVAKTKDMLVKITHSQMPVIKYQGQPM